MENSKITPKNVAIAVVAVIAIAAIGATIYVLSMGGSNVAPSASVPSNINTEVNTNTTEVGGQNNTNLSLAQEAAQYQKYVQEYSGRRLQFDNCVTAAPLVSVTYKNGTKVMLDNRSPEPQVITFDGKKYPLEAYYYAFVTLNYQNLPHTVSVDCNMNEQPQYNIGQIIVQQ